MDAQIQASTEALHKLTDAQHVCTALSFFDLPLMRHTPDSARYRVAITGITLKRAGVARSFSIDVGGGEGTLSEVWVTVLPVSVSTARRGRCGRLLALPPERRSRRGEERWRRLWVLMWHLPLLWRLRQRPRQHRPTCVDKPRLALAVARWRLSVRQPRPSLSAARTRLTTWTRAASRQPTAMIPSRGTCSLLPLCAT